MDSLPVAAHRAKSEQDSNLARDVTTLAFSKAKLPMDTATNGLGSGAYEA
jgi:hypothetical protein